MYRHDDKEVEATTELQNEIGEKLDALGFHPQGDSWGNIVHHLAEVTYMGRRLALEYLPKFLSLPPQDKGQLGELMFEIQSDLHEMNESISEMEDDLIKLVNFLNP